MKYYRRWRKGSHVPGSILFRRVKADYLGRCHISCGNPLAVAPVVGTRDSILFYPSGREFHGFERCTVNWNEEVPTAGVAVDVVGQSIRQIEASYGEGSKGGHLRVRCQGRLFLFPYRLGAGAQSLLGVRTDWDCHIYAREGADVHGRVESLRFGCPVAHVALSPWFAEAAVVAANGAVCLWSASCAQARCAACAARSIPVLLPRTERNRLSPARRTSCQPKTSWTRHGGALRSVHTRAYLFRPARAVWSCWILEFGTQRGPRRCSWRKTSAVTMSQGPGSRR